MTSSLIQKRSAGGVIYHNEKILVLEVVGRDEIVFPKGTIEVGETPEQAALREVREETGYDTKIITSLGTVSYKYTQDTQQYEKTVHHYLLELVDPRKEPVPDWQEGESFKNLWLTEKEAFVRLTHKESRLILQKALEFMHKS